MAEDFERGGSPLYGRLAREYSDDPRLAAVVGEHRPRWEIPLRLFGGVHYLELAGVEEPWSRFGEVLERHAEWLARFVDEQPVQTNEIQRCWGLLPGFLTAGAGSRLDLLELGPSAGLNLFWDRYRYSYPGAEWGPRDAPIHLSGEARGGPPSRLFRDKVRVGRRVGVDRRPVDVTSDHGARLLEAFVWADQSHRIERLRAAIRVARRHPPRLVEGDYVELLPDLLARREDDALTVVYHSASVVYLPPETRERLRAAIEEAGAEGPLAWLSFESVEESPKNYVFMLELRKWPGGERRRLARLDGHANRLEWLDGAL